MSDRIMRLSAWAAVFMTTTAAVWSLCSPALAAPPLPGSRLIGGPMAGGPLGGPSGALGQGVSGLASQATTGLALTAVGTWVAGGATFVLHETAHVMAETTAPHLESTWFSAAYWKVAGIAAVLTLPFLFAASVQALVASDLTLLVRAALGYLPLAVLSVAIAAPVTMLLLSASDQLAAAVSSAAGQQSANFLERAVGPLGALGTSSGSPFLVFLVALFIVAGALVLWMELLMREAAVYVIVLMLPLAFAAFVWPARRIWAIRSVELLVALILSKFAIVAVLALGGTALGHSVNGSVAGVLAGAVLLVLAAFAPWALLRLLPLAEIASGTAGALRGQSSLGLRALQHADAWATGADRWISTTAHMRRLADHSATSLPEPEPEPAPKPQPKSEPEPKPHERTAPVTRGSEGDGTPSGGEGPAERAANHPSPTGAAPPKPEPGAGPGATTKPDLRGETEEPQAGVPPAPQADEGDESRTLSVSNRTGSMPPPRRGGPDALGDTDQTWIKEGLAVYEGPGDSQDEGPGDSHDERPGDSREQA